MLFRSLDRARSLERDVVEFRRHLKKLGIDFEEQNIENAGYQMFLYDPVGTKIEFNVLNEQWFPITKSPVGLSCLRFSETCTGLCN